jgi:hypothetical protein
MEFSEKQLGWPPNAGDERLLASLAQRLEVSPGRFANYVIDRRPNGVVVVRPEAVYG